MFDEMFSDDVYDLDNSGGNYKLIPTVGGWRVIDTETPERFKAVFRDQNEARAFSEALNTLEADVEGLEALVEKYELNAGEND